MSLPRGATAVDFAYAVHTDIGNKCVAAKVNGELAPLRTELRNGDRIELCFRVRAAPVVLQNRRFVLLFIQDITGTYFFGSVDAFDKGVADRYQVKFANGATLLVEASWAVVQPVLDVWSETKFDLPNYAAGSWGPTEAGRLLEGCGGGWRHP